MDQTTLFCQERVIRKLQDCASRGSIPQGENKEVFFYQLLVLRKHLYQRRGIVLFYRVVKDVASNMQVPEEVMPYAPIVEKYIDSAEGERIPLALIGVLIELLNSIERKIWQQMKG